MLVATDASDIPQAVRVQIFHRRLISSTAERIVFLSPKVNLTSLYEVPYFFLYKKFIQHL